MKSNPKFSIIVPIFKVEKYLKKCIDSVLSQTYNDYELLLIDDGSPDSCPKICDEYQKQNKTIKVYHKKNGGLSDARNYGINRSKGDYLIFLDADDFWIDNEFLSNVSEIISKSKSIDLILFNSFKYYESKNKTIKPRYKVNHTFFELDSENKILYILENNIYKACAWDKVVNARIIKDNNILFPLNFLSEDMKWCGELLEHVKHLSIYDKTVYAYRQREGSISKNVSSKHIDDMIIQICDGIKNNNKNVLKYFAYEYAVLLLYSKIASNKQKKDIISISWILNYSVTKKGKMIKRIYKLLGFNITSYLLNFYIAIK